MKKPTQQFRNFARRLENGLGQSVTRGHATMKKRWRRSWTGRVLWPWFRNELEIVAKVAGMITLSLWVKRLIEQFLGAKVLKESVLRGEVNDIIRGIEQDVMQRRAKHGRRRK